MRDRGAIRDSYVSIDEFRENGVAVAFEVLGKEGATVIGSGKNPERPSPDFGSYSRIDRAMTHTSYN